MSWLYEMSFKRHDFGKITKHEGNIKMFLRGTPYYLNRDYEDYWFVDKEGNKIEHLTTWDKPKDGLVRNRRVYLEKEDDDKAIALLAENIEEDIKKLNTRAENLKKLIKKLEVTGEAKDE